MLAALAIAAVCLNPLAALSRAHVPPQFPEAISRSLAVHAIALADTRPFQKWNDMLKRWAQHNVSRDSSEEKTWLDLIEQFRELPKEMWLDAVHEVINTVPYRSDMAVWHRDDYWASPQEFLEKQAGDCEDFAIAKYFALRELGLAPERMMLVAYQNASIGYHIVLIANTDAGALVLDNRLSRPVPVASYAIDMPLFAVSETGIWWLTRPEEPKRFLEG
jgi:predicted transglutaminase-like cysteine proteinase